MATFATLTITADDIAGIDFNDRRTSAFIEANTPNSVIIVDGDEFRIGGRRTSPTDGVITFADLVTTDSADNPASFSYRVTFVYTPNGGRKQETFTTGWFPLTASANLAAIPEAWDDITAPVLWRSEFMDQAEALLAQQELVAGLTGEDDAVALLVNTPASDTAVALSATIEAGVAPVRQRVRPRGGTIMCLGDSISNNGWTTTRLAFAADDRAYLVHAALRSKGALTLYQPPGLNNGPSRSTGGYTSTQIRTTHLPEVIAAAPAICVVLAGTNDRPDLSADISTLKTNLTAIYDELIEAGILPVACTLPPRGSNGAFIGAVCGAYNNTHANAWIRREAQKRGIPLADFHKVLTDPATYGDFATGMNATGDNVHPSGAGGVAMGAEVYRALIPFLGPNVGVTLADANTAKSASESIDLVKTATGNSLFLVDTNADGVANGWTKLTGDSGPVLPTLANPASVGNYQTVTRNANDHWYYNTTNMALPTPGDRMLFAFEVQSTVKSVGGNMEVRVQLADTANTILAGYVLSEDIPAGSVYAVEFTIPTPTAGQEANWYPSARFGAKGASGAEVRVGRMVMLNLTAAGAL